MTQHTPLRLEIAVGFSSDPKSERHCTNYAGQGKNEEDWGSRGSTKHIQEDRKKEDTCFFMLTRNNHRLSIASKKIGTPSELDKLEKLIVMSCSCSFTKLAQLHRFMLLHDVKILSGEKLNLN